MMENEEIEAWAEGVIIGAWHNSWTKPETRCKNPSSGVYRISGWGGTVAGAISYLATNALTKKLWAKPGFPIFLVTMADFFPTKGTMAESPPLMCHWRPGIDGELIIVAWRDLWVKPEKGQGQGLELQGQGQGLDILSRPRTQTLVLKDFNLSPS